MFPSVAHRQSSGSSTSGLPTPDGLRTRVNARWIMRSSTFGTPNGRSNPPGLGIKTGRAVAAWQVSFISPECVL